MVGCLDFNVYCSLSFPLLFQIAFLLIFRIAKIKSQRKIHTHNISMFIQIGCIYLLVQRTIELIYSILIHKKQFVYFRNSVFSFSLACQKNDETKNVRHTQIHCPENSPTIWEKEKSSDLRHTQCIKYTKLTVPCLSFYQQHSYRLWPFFSHSIRLIVFDSSTTTTSLVVITNIHIAHIRHHMHTQRTSSVFHSAHVLVIKMHTKT